MPFISVANFEIVVIAAGLQIIPNIRGAALKLPREEVMLRKIKKTLSLSYLLHIIDHFLIVTSIIHRDDMHAY